MIEPKHVCAGWKPIFTSRTDVLSEPTAKQILGHNLNGVEQDCWGKPEKEPVQPSPQG